MSTFKVTVIARNPKREESATQPVLALVDTGSELTWLPADVLKAVGITPRRKRMFATGTQQQNWWLTSRQTKSGQVRVPARTARQRTLAVQPA